jgi:hypothetical protein
MRNGLMCVSLLLMFFLVPCHAMDEGQAGLLPADTLVTKEYNMLMQVRGQEITGICVMNIAPENNIVGTVVNEFGVKAFDFTFSQGKAKVLNVVGPLNKWYIRKVLRGDFAFILSNIDTNKDFIKKKRRISFLPNGDISASNDRFKIRYTFTPMNSKQ